MNLQALLTTVFAVNTCLIEKSLHQAPQPQPKLLSDPFFQIEGPYFYEEEKNWIGFESWIKHLIDKGASSIQILSANGVYQCGFLVHKQNQTEAWFTAHAQDVHGYAVTFKDPFLDQQNRSESWFIKKEKFQLQKEMYSSEKWNELGRKLLSTVSLNENEADRLKKITERILPTENHQYTAQDREILKVVLKVASNDDFDNETRHLAQLAVHSLGS